MKDANKFLQKIDLMLEKERGKRSEKYDSIMCFGGNVEGSALLMHGQPGMFQAIIVNEMMKDDAVAQVILQAVAAYQAIEGEQQKKKDKIVS